MRFLLLSLTVFFLAACANEPPDNPQNPAQAKAEVKARDDFARTLPKPPER